MPTRRVLKKTSPPPRGGRVASEARASSTPRILSSEEKRELILAHAAARRPVDPVQRMSLWAGVAVCLVFVVGAWVYSVGSGIKQTFAHATDPDLARSAELTKEFLNSSEQDGAEVSNELQRGVKTIADRLDELEAQERLIQAMAAEISTSTDSTALFQASTSSSNTTTTDSQTP